MRTTFSPGMETFFDKLPVLVEAEKRFRQEWAEMLASLHDRVAVEDWVVRYDCPEPHEMIKILRSDWPAGESGIHYEFGAFDQFRRQGVIDVSLHFEQEVPNQEQVCKCMRRLLRPHWGRLNGTLPGIAPHLPESPTHDIIKGRLPLASATSEVLYETFKALATTESFVDESIFLAERTSVWRTDFLKNDPYPCLQWGASLGAGETGGWEIIGVGGRLHSGALRCHARKSNYHDGQNILTLNGGKPCFDLAPDRRFYACAVVQIPHGCDVKFCLQSVHKNNAYQDAFYGTQSARASAHWQVLTWEGEINRLKDYDVARDGLFAYLIAGPLQDSIVIDSIQIGQS